MSGPKFRWTALCWAFVIGIWLGRWGERHHPMFAESINDCLTRQIFKRNAPSYEAAVFACKPQSEDAK